MANNPRSGKDLGQVFVKKVENFTKEEKKRIKNLFAYNSRDSLYKEGQPVTDIKTQMY